MFSNISAAETRLLPVFVYGSEKLSHQRSIVRSKGFILYSQFSLCKQGEGVFTDNNSVSFPVREGDIIYFQSSTPHAYKPVTKKWEVEYIVAGGLALERAMDCVGFSKSGVVTPRSEDKAEISCLFSSIIQINSRCTENSHAECSRLLYRLIMKTALAFAPPDDRKKALAVPCADYLRRNYMNDISISALAESLGISPTYMGIVFKEVYKTTPQRFLTTIRIETAKKLLARNKSMRLSEIAELSGFNSTSYLCNIFKRHTGMSPEEYRRLNTYDN